MIVESDIMRIGFTTGVVRPDRSRSKAPPPPELFDQNHSSGKASRSFDQNQPQTCLGDEVGSG